MTVVAGFLALMFCCNELPFIQTPTDSTPPPPVTNPEAKSIPGGAKITYDIPSSDDDISYVKAEYNYKGKLWTVRTSIYNDTLLIEGLGSVEPVIATLYVVDHSENISKPATVSFTPETPPVETIFNSLNLVADFGGILVTWTNETTTEIGISVLVEDSLGIMREQNTKFSKEKDGILVFRGFDPKEARFAVTIVDKWGNTSDTKETVLTPLFERLLDKSTFSTANLPGDNQTIYNNQLYKAWFDGNTTSLWVSDITDASWNFPMYVSLDFGVIAQLSRFRLWPQPNFYYGNYTFRKFEVWGTDELKSGMSETYWKDGTWKTDWIKFNDYEVKRPSGNTAPTNSPTGEDLAAAQAGWEFLVPLEMPKCRYVRFVINTIWSSGAGLCMGEVSFWGDDGKIQ
ncbi:hypothetical protein EZS27_025937 [termite gut metagenome]|uniref:F5/8 type C domain-containing protein n=1 Tax=termite gut metagenome TaxID=433724 RepID=A0A5J4QUG5_9ZZZZ